MSILSGSAFCLDNAAPCLGYADYVLYIFVGLALGGIRLYPRSPHGIDGVIQGVYKDSYILEELHGGSLGRFIV